MSSATLYPPCPTRTAIQVVPGKNIQPAPEDSKLPKVALVSWQKIGPGEYRPVVRIHERWVKLTCDLPEQLGMGIDYRTVMRLATAGFIASRRPTPNSLLLDLESWFTHLEATKDPEFWDRRDDPSVRLTNRERYLAVI
jgi:hypothetical protein